MSNRKRWIFLAKLAVSVGIIVWIVRRIVLREGAGELWQRISDLHWSWIALAALMQIAAVFCATVRWDLLLSGQGIRAPFRHLLGSFMIGRFFGAFTPAGLGLQGYKLYDIATQTGKVARATAQVGIEMVLGWLGFGAVVVAGSLFGLRFLGARGLLLVDGFFLGLVVLAVVLITRPALFRIIAARLPGAFRSRLQTTIDAVCAYQGRGLLVSKAAGLSMAIHAFNNLIYVCTARALGAELGPGEIFFASALQIFSTLMPVSINGIGLREATAVALYTAVGVPPAMAFLIPTVGFAVEMLISSFGGLIFMARRVGYKVQIDVDEAEREQVTHAEIERVPAERWPRSGRAAVIGMGGGLLGGALLGLGEGGVIVGSATSAIDLSVFVYGVLSYGFVGATTCTVVAWLLAVGGRLMHREAVAEPLAYARSCAAVLATGGFVLGAFRVRRDLFQESFAFKSANGLLLLAGSALVALILYFVAVQLVRSLVTHRSGRSLLGWWGTPALAVLLLGCLGAGALFTRSAAVPVRPVSASKKTAPERAGNILFIIVDTLRADHLPLYGYREIETPNLDAFARDAIRFENAFSNSSWTRPSFASSLTGRYPSNHKTITKFDSLPGELTTLPEALGAGGYVTFGVVTNYNLAPFFNYDQGFDVYRYLEPEFVLGASDAAVKLLSLQIYRRLDEKVRDRLGRVRKNSDYQDARAVNRAIVEFLDRKPPEPWFAFVGYMDPHDPYYSHPFDGTGQSRAAKQKPHPSEAPRLRKLYDGEIVYWDEQFGRLVTELRRRDLYDRTTVVVTADHGEEFMEHGGFWHGTSLYDEQVHVPLLLKLPHNAQQGTVIHHWVESVDVMPTLLAQAGLQVPEGVQGKDLFVPSAEVFAEENLEGNVLESLRYRRGESELKVITANPDNPRGLKPVELYRVDTDPGEKSDLSERQKDEAKVAVTDLDAYADQAVRGAVRRREVQMSDEQKERLRRLGYMVD
jgi:arylsulfatase A-like enzyme/uncharacterized membrane protein YbhN (UPF0104 family)